MTRTPSSEKTRQAIRAFLEQGMESGDAKSNLMWMAMRLIVEEALEAKVRNRLGRGYYERGAARGSRKSCPQGHILNTKYFVSLQIDHIAKLNI